RRPGGRGAPARGHYQRRVPKRPPRHRNAGEHGARSETLRAGTTSRDTRWTRRGLSQLEAFEVARRAPLLEDAEKLHRAAAVEPVLSAALSRLAFVVVVAGCAALEKLAGEHREADDRRHPLLLGFFRDLDRAHVTVDGVLDDVGDVLALLVQHVRKIHREA